MNVSRPVASAFRRTGFWLEWHHELRRHAGDERLPPDLRVHLRERAQRALGRSTSALPAPFPRRQLRDAAPVLLPPELRDAAVRAATVLGLDLHTRFVAFDVRRNPASIVPAIDWLLTRGYTVLRIGDVSDPIHRSGVVDVRARARQSTNPLGSDSAASRERVAPGGAAPPAAQAPARDRSFPAPRTGGATRRQDPPRYIEDQGIPGLDLVDRIVIEKASFVVCDSGERQQAAVLASTPSLRLNAREPFSAYPVRGNDIFTLADIVDLDSGRVLLSNELLSEAYLRHVRNYGLRPNRSEQVLAAVQEIHEGVNTGWREDANQMRVRDRVTEAGVLLASRVPVVAEWGPDEGFLGDGRLARCQAGAFSREVR